MPVGIPVPSIPSVPIPQGSAVRRAKSHTAGGCYYVEESEDIDGDNEQSNSIEPPSMSNLFQDSNHVLIQTPGQQSGTPNRTNGVNTSNTSSLLKKTPGSAVQRSASQPSEISQAKAKPVAGRIRTPGAHRKIVRRGPFSLASSLKKPDWAKKINESKLGPLGIAL